MSGPATWANRVRGLVLGLALGDSVGRGVVPASGPIRAGVSTQLAAFTIDGIIRAWIRGEHKGVCHPPSVVWHAYCRWAALQGIQLHKRHQKCIEGEKWPDGWLADVSILRERRGSAPATVKALTGADTQPSSSFGCHALTRALPMAALHRKLTADKLADLARDVAALTHGELHAGHPTAAAVVLAARCLSMATFEEATGLEPDLIRLPHVAWLFGMVHEALGHVRQAPRQKARLAQVAPDATASAALSGGVYVAASYPAPGEAMEALAFAATAPDGDSVAVVAGALLGALHGVDVWPVELISRLELAWVMDTLARDLALQITESPAGDGYGPPKDPFWWDRYPGW
ncbi:ADP-ribosylglycohydrolase family protein [Planomonospora alba]|uniref:ADP-ribosylglycohydrolase family protein n=1 Tax=Planomonospora alba TaxID=161354 RepID=A0ABP6MND7_9ACTN